MMKPPREIDYAIDYYAVLQVAPTATEEEIQRSFRRLVLEHHPDKNPDRREGSEQRIRELIEANEILGNEETRRMFDSVRRMRLTKPRREEPFFLRKRGPGARALTVLHYLLNGRPDDAVEILVEQEAEYGSDFLLEYLDPKDFLDCLFLLAEYFLDAKDYPEAVRRLRAFWRHEREAKYRRHYFDEVVRLLKDLYLRKLPRVLEPEETLGYLEEAGSLQLSAKEKLLWLEKTAEMRARVGDPAGAREALDEITAIDPKFKGLDRLAALFD